LIFSHGSLQIRTADVIGRLVLKYRQYAAQFQGFLDRIQRFLIVLGGNAAVSSANSTDLCGFAEKTAVFSEDCRRSLRVIFGCQFWFSIVTTTLPVDLRWASSSNASLARSSGIRCDTCGCSCPSVCIAKRSARLSVSAFGLNFR